MRKSIAAVTILVMAMSLTACGGSKTAYTAGTYNTTATGMGGDVKVAVTFTEDKIDKVEVVEHAETEGISDPAIAQIPTAIVEKQSADVDAVTGATVTSTAIKEAVKTAITEATK